MHSKFTLVISASDTSINGFTAIATNNTEADIEGVLQPVMGQDQASVFYIGESTGHVVTDSEISGEQRFGYIFYANYTSSLRFGFPASLARTVYYPNFTISEDGSFSTVGNDNLTWAGIIVVFLH